MYTDETFADYKCAEIEETPLPDTEEDDLEVEVQLPEEDEAEELEESDEEREN